MISRRLLLASALAFAASPAFAQNPDPAAIVRSIYRKADPYGAAAALQLRAEKRETVLSKSFAALWKRSDDAEPEGEAPPGFDVASNSQGMDVARADVKVEKRAAARATVVARLIAGHPFVRHSPEENVVRYDFVRENGRWKIDDVRSTSDGKEWSLRGILNEGLAAREDQKQ